MNTSSSSPGVFSSVTAKPTLSDIRGFFRNTVTPSNRPIISQFLLDTETELKECRAEINRLKTSIYLLENKKSNLEDRLKQCRSLLSPIHRLPTETLADIFVYACEGNKLTPSSSLAVILLSTICGRWRNVVLTTPRLWSFLEIDLGTWKEKADHLVSSITLFMERSKACPLDITCAFPADESGTNEWIASVFDAMSRSCARWRSVSFSLPAHITLPNHLFLNLRGQDFPLLQYLQIRQKSESKADGPVTNPDIFSGVFDVATSLRTLDVETSFMSDIRLPHHQITRLTIFRQWSAKCLAFLRLFQQLQELRLHHIVVNAEGPEHLVSNTIETLWLSLQSQSDHDTLMMHMTLPGLTSLTFSSREAFRKDVIQHWPVWEAATTMDFLSRSGCSLTAICLKSLPITDEQTIALLQTMPQLTSLQIEELEFPGSATTDPPHNMNRIVTDRFLQRLVVRQEGYKLEPPGTLLLPLLANFTVKLHAQNLPEQSLLATVSSRWIPDPTRARDIGVECLRSANVIVMGGEDSETTLESLRCFGYAGLRLTIDCIKASS
ncbi:hypothetical protein PQX77_003548 [Marasmius sp. AFHP31]|nr:hypothetical protein PQX77_003548 [Marasmius sp. AFHP31]